MAQTQIFPFRMVEVAKKLLSKIRRQKKGTTGCEPLPARVFFRPLLPSAAEQGRPNTPPLSPSPSTVCPPVAQWQVHCGRTASAGQKQKPHGAHGRRRYCTVEVKKNSMGKPNSKGKGKAKLGGAGLQFDFQCGTKLFGHFFLFLLVNGWCWIADTMNFQSSNSISIQVPAVLYSFFRY